MFARLSSRPWLRAALLSALCAALLAAPSARVRAQATTPANEPASNPPSAPRATVSQADSAQLADDFSPVEWEGAGPQGSVLSAYQSYIDAALREYRGHRFPEARSLFTKAHATFPNARTLRGLAMVEFELRNYVESAALFARALREEARPLTGALRRDTVQLQKKAEGFVAHYELVSETPLVIVVDGVQAQPARGSSIALAVGDHVLELAALGYASQRRLLRVRGGERETLEVALAPLEASVDTASHEPARAAATPAAPLALEVEQRPGEARPLYKNRWLWTGVGVAVAALALGLGFGLSAHQGRTEAPISDKPVAIRSGP